MLQLRNEVLYKVAESILQFRVQVKQEQFAKFNALVKQINNHNKNAFQRSTSKMLTSIILEQRYKIRETAQQKQIDLQQVINMQIQFYLKDRQTQASFQTQVWKISFGVKNNLADPQNFQMLLNIFQELIVHLNKRPMFNIYQKNKQLRKKYHVSHKIYFQQKQIPSLLKLPRVQKQFRQSQSLIFNINCYYTADLDSLVSSQSQSQIEKQPRKQSVDLQSSQHSPKVSVYSFYDPMLNFTFISSDSQDFKSKENLKHHELQNQNSDDQFQILIMSEDQIFVDQNSKIFKSFSELESSYFNSNNYMN